MRGQLLAFGLVVCVVVLASAQAGAPSIEPGISLEQCWWPEVSPQERRAAQPASSIGTP
jgi:uncharacterized protein (UPF0333 family)